MTFPAVSDRNLLEELKIPHRKVIDQWRENITVPIFENVAIIAMRQIAKKSIEFNKPAFIYFVNLTKAFDQGRLQSVIDILEDI